ncbi:MAG: discoidin domain-containing protein, partial [Chitinophagaceae bacterium]
VPAGIPVNDPVDNFINIDAASGHVSNSFRPNHALGTSIDMLDTGSVDALYTPEVIKECLAAGWGSMTYRQHTELQIAAWHWNPNGTWSDPKNKSGYFTGNSEPTEFLRHSYGYRLPHRGNTRNNGTLSGYSRMTDGNPSTYWKSNPYLTNHFTGEPDKSNPQWVVIDFGLAQPIQAIRIDWANPYARTYHVEYWSGSGDAMNDPVSGKWIVFPNGAVKDGQGGSVMIKLSPSPVTSRYIRIVMTESSNTPDTHGGTDLRNNAGYAIYELYAGLIDSEGHTVDTMVHSPDQNQTATYCSSIDPWHSEADLHVEGGDQTGFDLFFTSGVTNHFSAIIPIAMLYGCPENAAAEIAYLKKRGYPVRYVEMGEEPDGQYMLPEHYAQLYIQFADAIHHLVSDAKLGGPIFTGQNEDIKVWPDAQGRTSWLGRFLAYLKSHGHLSDLSFMSFEHYPFEPCATTWNDLYREPELVSHILQVWRDDGLPENVPMLITESNLSWNLNPFFVDIFGALWLAEYAGAFLTAGGAAMYYFHFFPRPLSNGCHGWGTFGMFNADEHYHIKQYTSQYFASRLINLEWVKPGDEIHKTYNASSTLRDSLGRELLAGWVVERPDHLWAMLVVNRDPLSAHSAGVKFNQGNNSSGYFSGLVTMVTFGREQYHWHSDGAKSHADPDGPEVHSMVPGGAEARFTFPPASITILRGEVKGLS